MLKKSSKSCDLKGFPIFVPFQFHGAEGVETEDEANRSRFFRSHRREHLRGVLACRHKWSGNLKRMWRYPKEIIVLIKDLFFFKSAIEIKGTICNMFAVTIHIYI